jgi:phosphomannomutase
VACDCSGQPSFASFFKVPYVTIPGPLETPVFQNFVFLSGSQFRMKPKRNLMQKIINRLQGTDGVRREIKPAKDHECRGQTPQQVFLEKGWITEEFMELYAYCYVKNQSGQKSTPSKKRTIVIGWDPRDPSGIFTEAVVRGVRKADANALVLGIVPTPLVPLFMLHGEADGGIMVTASHNPEDQNGIKLFLPFHGMKPLPSDDAELTRYLLKQNFNTIKKISTLGAKTDCRKKALELFRQFSLLPENSWIKSPDTLKNLILVVDPACGALAGIAAPIFREAGVSKVYEVNKNGAVNLRSGVADLEGCPRITADMILKSRFHRHKAIVKLFEIGRANQKAAMSGEKRIAAAVFDADGDRFFRLEYDPFQDALWVLSGDETAILQARYLMTHFPDRYKGSLYINTVESDLNASTAAEAMGLNPLLTAVGDKWILLKIHLALLEQRLTKLAKTKKTQFKSKIKPLQKNGVASVNVLLNLDTALPENSAKNNSEVLAVGSEETGHNITTGYFTLADKKIQVFSGNGLKSALNTFAATEQLATTLSPKRYILSIRQPFTPGFKSTLYIYYIRQDLFYRDSQVWRKVKRLLMQSAKQNGYTAQTQNFPDDPDMLYISLAEGKAGIFVRNSGTENKISVNLRGRKSTANKLKKIGLEIQKLLFSLLKDRNNSLYKMELYALSQIAGHSVTDEKLEIKKPYRLRLINEMKKQNLIQSSSEGNKLTPLGKWYIIH